MKHNHGMQGCPGARTLDFTAEKSGGGGATDQPSQLRQWPIQLHLVSPAAPYFADADVVLAADCTAFALGGFHNKYLKGKSVAIGCPKLDEGQEIYVEKVKALIEEAGINTLTVVIMEVPCCGGLLQIAKKAAGEAKRKIPVKSVVAGIKGDIISENWE